MNGEIIKVLLFSFIIGLTLLTFFSLVKAIDVTDCMNIENPGIYYLITDIVNSSARYCMNISANDVTLDCQGHTISSDTASCFGINDDTGDAIIIERNTPTTTNITIKNCVISSFLNGIYIANANENLLSNITSNDNCAYMDVSLNERYGKGILLFNSSNNTLENIVANNNIFANAASGLLLKNSNYNTLKNITANENEGSGIHLKNSNYNQMTNITIDSLRNDGYEYSLLYIEGSSFNNITNAYLVNSYLHGMVIGNTDELIPSNNNTLSQITISNSSYYGIWFYGSENNVLHDSKIQNSGDTGIVVETSSKNNLIYNNFFENSNNAFISDADRNFWNITKQNGTRIEGDGNYIGGNYWTNLNDGYSYTCNDSDEDGICDSPYDILYNAPCIAGVNCSSNTDYLPLKGEISILCNNYTVITGKVFEDNNIPVVNASVELFINGIFFGNSTTNNQGNYNISLINYSLNYPLTLQATIDGKKFNKTSNIICGTNNTIDIYTTTSTSIYNLVPIIVYTKDEDDNYERTFGHGQTVDVNVVFRNPTKFSVSGVFDVKIIYEDGGLVSYLFNDLNIDLEPSSSKNYSFSYTIPSNLGWFESSGYDFYGYKVYVSVVEDCALINNTVEKLLCYLQNSNRYAFFIDQYKEPRWLRDTRMINIGGELNNLIKIARERNDLDYLTTEFENLIERVKDSGFNTIYFGSDYYSYGNFESHQPMIDYWSPTGNTSDSHYSTPPKDLIELTGGLTQARNTIKSLVDKAHDNSLKVVVYTDPIIMYDPNDFTKIIDPYYVTHHNSTSQSYVRLIEKCDIFNPWNCWLEPKRVNFVEVDPLIRPFTGSLADYFLVETSACGGSKNGNANNDYGFSPSVISSDLASGENWQNDPSYHYHMVKQLYWLTKNYGFDGILADDIGRVIMNVDHGKIAGDLGAYWRGLYATSPSNSKYGISENYDCEQIKQQSGVTDDAVTADSVAGMLKHMRNQIKSYSSANGLIISDYFVPSSIGWASVYGTTDMHNSDQFPQLYPEFADYMYSNFMYDFKPVRTDLRRALTFEFANLHPSYKREAWFRGALLGAAWANRANVEITYDDFLIQSPYSIEQNVTSMYTNYNRMREQLDNDPNFRIYTTMVGQELLYNSLLPEIQRGTEISYVACKVDSWSDYGSCSKPYFILYELPSSYGVSSRILHIINDRNNDFGTPTSGIRTDYTFKIRIPYGQQVESVYLISPDAISISGQLHPDPNADNIPDDNYYVNIKDDPTLFSIEDDYITVTAPKVIAYTIVYVKFTPIQDPSENLKYSPNILESFSLFSTSDINQSQYIDQNMNIPSNTTLLDISLYYPIGKLDLHLYDSINRHIGFNYSTNITDLIPNSNYYSEPGKEEINVNNPINGTWKISVYGNSIPSEYNLTGITFTLRTLKKGNYMPYLNISLPDRNLTLNEFTYLPFNVTNVGDALAFNVSVLFGSSSFYFYKHEFSDERLLSENSISSMIPVIPLKNGTVFINYNLSYLDENFNSYYLLSSISINVVVKPKLSLWEACNVQRGRFNSLGSCFINVTNIGSDKAINITIINLLSQGIQNSSVANFSMNEILPNQSLIFNYNITLENGDRNIIVYADYQNSDGEVFRDAYALNLFIEEDTTPPIITILSPLNKTYYSNSVPLTFEINEPTSWIGYKLDNQLTVTIIGNTIVNVSDGGHNILVYANDTSYNTGYSQIYFTNDHDQYLPWETSYITTESYPVIDIEEYNNKLYFAANNKLYIFDGSSWDIIQAPTNTLSLQAFGTKLYVAGNGGKIYSYDGVSWTEVFNTNSQYAKMLGIYNNRLYTGTYLAQPAKLYYYDGNNWQEDTNFSSILVCPSPFCSIDSLEEYSGKLYVGSGGIIYIYDGIWNITQNFTDIYAYQDMKVFNSKLYLATRDQSTRCPVYLGGSGFCGRVIEYDGANWSTVFDYSYPTYNGYWIYSLEEYHNKLYAGTANKIYKWDGTWQVNFNSLEGAQYAMVMKTWSDKIYVGFGNGMMFKDDINEPTTTTTSSTTTSSTTSTTTTRQTTTTVTCSCTAWKNTYELCFANRYGCAYKYERTCTPSGCNTETKCVSSRYCMV